MAARGRRVIGVDGGAVEDRSLPRRRARARRVHRLGPAVRRAVLALSEPAAEGLVVLRTVAVVHVAAAVRIEPARDLRQRVRPRRDRLRLECAIRPGGVHLGNALEVLIAQPQRVDDAQPAAARGLQALHVDGAVAIAMPRAGEGLARADDVQQRVRGSGATGVARTRPAHGDGAASAEALCPPRLSALHRDHGLRGGEGDLTPRTEDVRLLAIGDVQLRTRSSEILHAQFRLRGLVEQADAHIGNVAHGLDLGRLRGRVALVVVLDDPLRGPALGILARHGVGAPLGQPHAVAVAGAGQRELLGRRTRIRRGVGRRGDPRGAGPGEELLATARSGYLEGVEPRRNGLAGGIAKVPAERHFPGDIGRSRERAQRVTARIGDGQCRVHRAIGTRIERDAPTRSPGDAIALDGRWIEVATLPRRDGQSDVVEAGSKEDARARCRTDVAVTGDGLGGHLLARPVQGGGALSGPGTRRGQHGGAQGVDVIHVELPRDEVAHRVQDQPLGGRIWIEGVGIAQERHRERLGVEARCVGADDSPVHAAGPALVDAPEAVDHEVVAEVVHVDALGEPGVDVAHLLSRLRTGVVVGGHDVVHEGDLDLVRVGRRTPTQRLVGAPLGARDDRGLADGGLGGGCRSAAGEDFVLRSHGVVDESQLGVRGHRAGGGVDPDLDPIGLGGEHGLRREARLAPLLGVGIGQVLADRHLHPGQPLAVLTDAHDDAGLGIEGLGRGDAHQAERRGLGRRDGGGRLEPGRRARADDGALVDVVLAGDRDRCRRGRRGGQGTPGDAVEVDGGDLRADGVGGSSEAAGHG